MADTLPDLTGFQRDCLVAIGRMDNPKGLAIKRALDTHGYEDINHGRLYPNLDELADKGLISKDRHDDRTNAYSLTRRGERELGHYHRWVGSGILEEEDAQLAR